MKKVLLLVKLFGFSHKNLVVLNSGLILSSRKSNLKNNHNLIFVRYYPHHVNPPSKFSENTTEKEIKKYNEDHEEKVKNIDERDNDLHDDMINEFTKASGDKDKIKETYENFYSEIKSRSGKFLEEIKEDNRKIKDIVESSDGFTKETINKELTKLDKHLEEEIQAEGRHTKNLLEKLEREREDALGLDEMSSIASWESDDSNPRSLKDEKVEVDNNEKIAKSENNKMPQSEDKNKHSPIDYVLEKKDCEMPDIPDSDGGE